MSQRSSQARIPEAGQDAPDDRPNPNGARTAAAQGTRDGRAPALFIAHAELEKRFARELERSLADLLHSRAVRRKWSEELEGTVATDIYFDADAFHAGIDYRLQGTT